MMGYQMDLHNN